MNIKLILGDQLTLDSPLLTEFNPASDILLMAEVSRESQAPSLVSSKMRTTLFLSAMRHFADSLNAQNLPLIYYPLTAGHPSISAAIEAALQELSNKHPDQSHSLSVVLPGDSRLLKELKSLSEKIGLKLNTLPDTHFLAETGEFKQWIGQYKQPRMEYWYRHLRKRLNILVDAKQKPEGGAWNFDKDNRKAFGKAGPPQRPIPLTFAEDAITRQVKIDMENAGLELPGNNTAFCWPVSREQALQALDDFIQHRLPLFGDYQDAMWREEPFLYHSLISSSLNLKLLDPREVITAAVEAYRQGKAPLNAVEGFVRQIAGWREYVRGLYWLRHDDWEQMNGLEHQHSLPEFYWHGETPMHCLSQSIKQVLDYGYGHHIQRLMVTGLFALLYRADPQAVHRWYLAMYVDAVAWVEIPNTIGMSQYADQGFLASKPYIASGSYIQRMSNYCSHCRFNPKKAQGEDACPFTTLYWSFIDHHQGWLQQNPRLGMQVRNWHNKATEEQQQIRERAELIFSTGASMWN